MHTDDIRPLTECHAAGDEPTERAALLRDLASLRKALGDSRTGKGRDARQVLRDIACKISAKIDR